MYEYTIRLNVDLLGRHAANLVNQTRFVEGDVYFLNDTVCVNAKSLLGVLTLHALFGQTITIKTTNSASLSKVLDIITNL